MEAFFKDVLRSSHYCDFQPNLQVAYNNTDRA